MIPLIVIRPEPGCAASVAGGRALGLEAQGFPLFSIEPRDWEPADPASLDALLIGSANALRHAGPSLARYRALPVHAVGEATAEAARALGFEMASVGSGGLQAVLDGIAAPARLLRLAGEERIALVPPPGVSLVERVTYASAPQPMPQALVRLLAAPAVVLLHSAEAAAHFTRECDRLGIAHAQLTLAALGPRIAGAAGAGWAHIAISPTPREAPLLALAEQLCQSAGHSI